MVLPEINLEDFQNIDLRVGEVVKAERVEEQSSFGFAVNLGEEESLVAGLANYYTPES